MLKNTCVSSEIVLSSSEQGRARCELCIELGSCIQRSFSTRGCLSEFEGERAEEA